MEIRRWSTAWLCHRLGSLPRANHYVWQVSSPLPWNEITHVLHPYGTKQTDIITLRSRESCSVPSRPVFARINAIRPGGLMASKCGRQGRICIPSDLICAPWDL